MDITGIYHAPQEKPRADYTRPIARTGEEQFACILRNRTGESAGCIDFGLRPLKGRLCEAEQQEICDVAYALYESICHDTGKTASKAR